MLSNVIINAPPARIQAALEFLRFCDQRENPEALFEGCRPDPKNLSRNEQKAYDTAIELMRAYFAGELELEDSMEEIEEYIPPEGPAPVNIID